MDGITDFGFQRNWRAAVKLLSERTGIAADKIPKLDKYLGRAHAIWEGQFPIIVTETAPPNTRVRREGREVVFIPLGPHHQRTERQYAVFRLQDYNKFRPLFIDHLPTPDVFMPRQEEVRRRKKGQFEGWSLERRAQTLVNQRVWYANLSRFISGNHYRDFSDLSFLFDQGMLDSHTDDLWRKLAKDMAEAATGVEREGDRVTHILNFDALEKNRQWNDEDRREITGQIFAALSSGKPQNRFAGVDKIRAHMDGRALEVMDAAQAQTRATYEWLTPITQLLRRWKFQERLHAPDAQARAARACLLEQFPVLSLWPDFTNHAALKDLHQYEGTPFEQVKITETLLQLGDHKDMAEKHAMATYLSGLRVHQVQPDGGVACDVPCSVWGDIPSLLTHLKYLEHARLPRSCDEWEGFKALVDFDGYCRKTGLRKTGQTIAEMMAAYGNFGDALYALFPGPNGRYRRVEEMEKMLLRIGASWVFPYVMNQVADNKWLRLARETTQEGGRRIRDLFDRFAPREVLKLCHLFRRHVRGSEPGEHAARFVKAAGGNTLLTLLFSQVSIPELLKSAANFETQLKIWDENRQHKALKDMFAGSADAYGWEPLPNPPISLDLNYDIGVISSAKVLADADSELPRGHSFHHAHRVVLDRMHYILAQSKIDGQIVAVVALREEQGDDEPYISLVVDPQISQGEHGESLLYLRDNNRLYHDVQNYLEWLNRQKLPARPYRQRREQLVAAAEKRMTVNHLAGHDIGNTVQNMQAAQRLKPYLPSGADTLLAMLCKDVICHMLAESRDMVKLPRYTYSPEGPGARKWVAAHRVLPLPSAE